MLHFVLLAELVVDIRKVYGLVQMLLLRADVENVDTSQVLVEVLRSICNVLKDLRVYLLRFRLVLV